jgi:hypothetical protein
VHDICTERSYAHDMFTESVMETCGIDSRPLDRDRWVDVHGLTIIVQRCCALATDTPTSMAIMIFENPGTRALVHQTIKEQTRTSSTSTKL